jgi:pimeloyl-ACP methyl ester carboxylesterase
MPPAATTVEVLGRKIHEVRGGRGEPLLYLHSAMGETSWSPHVAALAERHELHAPAHPGFLGSEGIEEIRDIDDVIDHYEAYLDVMGWESVDVIGLSFGGWMAAELAVRVPGRVRRLVLASACGIWIREQPIADIFAFDTRFPERQRALLFCDTSCPAAQMIVAPGEAQLPDELLADIMNGLAATAKIGWNPLLHDPKLEGRLHRITAETLCLWGEQDRVVPRAYGERFAERIPRARLEVIPRCGHLAPLEQPGPWLAAVERFLA